MFLNPMLANLQVAMGGLVLSIEQRLHKPAPPTQPGNYRRHYRIQPLIQRLLRMEAVTRAGKKKSYVRLLRYSKAQPQP